MTKPDFSSQVIRSMNVLDAKAWGERKKQQFEMMGCVHVRISKKSLTFGSKTTHLAEGWRVKPEKLPEPKYL